MRTVFWVCFVMSITLSGCAGPMSPFGAINGFGRHGKGLFALVLPATSDGAIVHFSPSRQVLHAASTFSIILEDPEGVPENFDLVLSFDGLDVTNEFLSRAERSYVDAHGKQLRLTTKSLRLLPGRDNRILVSYRRGHGRNFITRQYAAPECSAFQVGRGIASIPEFRPGPGVLDSINRYSGGKSINPFFVAGLIAQESAFDPRALSLSRALGLTQITPLGEGEVIKRFGEWPRHPGTKDMSLIELRLAILRGQLHSGNEWRLNPDLSVRGGVEYLDYISTYWQKPEKRDLVDKYLGATDVAFSELILASYNSGPARVAEALDRRGSDWIKDDELSEARKYVGRVSSYCHHFTQSQRAD